MSLPSAPTSPNASGMCISRLRLSDGVGGTDCSISTTYSVASWLCDVVTVKLGVPA